MAGPGRRRHITCSQTAATPGTHMVVTTMASTPIETHTSDPICTDSETQPPDPSQIPNDSTSNSAPSRLKRGRGRTRGLSLSKHWAQRQNGPKLDISFRDGQYRPVDFSGKAFGTEVGIICRSFALITCGVWSKVDGSTKDMLFRRICDRFDIQVDRQDIREGINKFLGARFKSWKYHMHRHFKNFKTNVSEARRNPYDGVGLEDWQKVCDIFEDPKYKEKCQKNANNRKKLLTNHCGGSKPFVRARFEMRDENTGEEPDMVTFYKKTHYRESNGSWVTEECERMHAEMVKLLEPQHMDEASMSEPARLTPDEAFYMTYKSKSEYVIGLGHGQAPVRNMRRSQVEVAEARRRADEAQQRASDVEAQLRDQAEEVKQQKQAISDLRAQLSRLDDMMRKFLSSQMPSTESQPNDGA